MKFKMSPNIGIITQDLSATANFYTDVLGFKSSSRNDKMAEIDASPFTLFIMREDNPLGPVMELFVDDLEAARKLLATEGCKILHWQGQGGDCHVQDPFGMIFNLCER